MGCFSIGCLSILGLLVLGGIISAISDGVSGPSGAGLGSDTVATAPAKTPEQEKGDYVAQIDRELESLKSFDGAKYRTDKDAIDMGVILLGAWAMTIGNASQHALSDAEKAKVAELKRQISRVQVRELPKMRAAWAKQIGSAMWEHDMTVTAGGEGNRTLRLTAGIFAANANIKQVQETIHEKATLLRFRRIEYRWYKGADEYTYYTLDVPKDSEVRQITGSGFAPAE